MLDVVVIGAGPAGSITARRLAQRGRSVMVLEEHDVVGAPVHCTGLLGAEAFSEFDLPSDLILAEAGVARFWGAAGQSVPVQSSRINAVVIDRGRLDRYLAGEAESAGAQVLTGHRAEHIAVDGRSVVVRARGIDRPIEARACVLACGANYRWHRELGLGMPRVFLQSAQVETPFPDTQEIEVRFGREVAPSGFAWMVPFRREGVPHARIGLMSETRSGERCAAFIGSLAERAGVDEDTIPMPRQKMLPLGPIDKSYANRVLAVGDAAGLVKPTTGGGIYYGLLSGAIAAEVLDDGLSRDRLSERALRHYETRWRQRLGREIRVGLAFRKIAARLSDQSIDELIELAGVDGVVPLLQETAAFNWHRKAAIALLGHPAFRRIVFRSWTRSATSV
ncbi:MAG: NAD(P)/FAD-dependent oxidoreductase [Vicinamibacterales bacterium]